MSYTYNNTPVISKVTLPSGTEYYIKDSEARTKINDLDSRVSTLAVAGGMRYLGISATLVTDGGTESVYINGETIYTSGIDAGSVVIYDESEFIWNGTKWQLLGEVNQTFGDLAAADETIASYTPEGTVSQPTFSGTLSNVSLASSSSTSANSLEYVPSGTVSATWTGLSTTSTGSYTPAGSVTTTVATTSDTQVLVAPAESGTATYTPEGNISTPVVSKSADGTSSTIKNPTTINNVLSAINTSAPSSTAISNAIAYCSVANQTLSFNQLGTSSTAAIATTDISVRTGDATYTVSAPTFTGTGARLVTNSISIPATFSSSFSGTPATISVSGTPEGSITSSSFSGDAIYFSGTYTPAGTVSQPTFTGTAATIISQPVESNQPEGQSNPQPGGDSNN